MTGTRDRVLVGRVFVGMAGLVTAGLISLGCSSKSSPGDGGSGGTGDGGDGAVSKCMAAPSSGLIADFMGGDGGIEIGGKIYAYGGNAQPGYSIDSGAMNVMENNGATAGPQYVGVLVGFTECVNASAFSGVSFSIGGTFTGCTMQYSTNDAPHDDMSTDPKGTCTMGNLCYSPQAQVLASAVSQTQTIQEPWITTAGGVPPAPTDQTQLTAVQWQFTIPAAPDGGGDPCIANLNISNIRFYK